MSAVTIVEFIEARLAEDQAAAEAAASAPWHGPVPNGDMPRVESGSGGWVALTSDDPGGIRGGTAAHIARHDPARVLAQVAAMRAIVESHQPDHAADTWYWLERECAECHHRWHKFVPDTLPTEIGPERGCPTARHVAAVWSSHDDYDPAWAPEGE